MEGPAKDPPSLLRPPSSDIGPEGAAALAPGIAVSGALTSLDLSVNKLGDEAALTSIVRAVRQQDKIVSLNLERCGIDASGAVEIAEYVRASGALTSINLSSINHSFLSSINSFINSQN